ncbi:MAG: ABC transporter ATP-binding protein [Pseudomonadota bacterium]
MSTVEYDKVAKNYGNVKVMEDISFSIPDHSFVVLLGPSGCGKTTLLRMTAGLESITGGEIRIGGQRMNGVHPRDRDIAMVFQTYALYPQMTVFDNIAFALQVRGRPKPEIREKVEWAAEILDLTPLLKRKPAALSGGQRQRVAMGRALVRDPQVFLFDEPLSNLDAKLRAQMRYEIRRIHDRLGATTVYVTHDQVEAMTMADEIVIMRGGEIMQKGSPDDVYDKPANLFVADFIGSPAINLLPGVLEGIGDAPGVRFKGSVLPISAVKADAGAKVTYGVRPVDIGLSDHGPIKGEVLMAETTGAETLLHVDLEGEELRVVLPERRRLKHGEVVHLSIDPSKVHVFDEASEARLS